VIKVGSTLGRLAAGAAAVALIAAVEAAFGVARSDTEPPGPLEPGNAGAPAELRQCGDCHMVFPSRMLPSRSWTAILSTMGDHFGEDAAIPKKDLDDIRDFLTSHAADSPDATPRERHFLSALLPNSTPLRITAMPWWNQMHADFNFDGVKHSAVKSAANCLACHYGKVIR
jgi:Dihaem cytochrome c